MEISQNNILEPSHYNQQIFEMEIHFPVREEMMDSKEIIDNEEEYFFVILFAI